jgi:hypothetical protein
MIVADLFVIVADLMIVADLGRGVALPGQMTFAAGLQTDGTR